MMSEIDFGKSEGVSDLNPFLEEFSDAFASGKLEPGQTEALIYDLLARSLGCQEGQKLSDFSEEKRRQAVEEVSGIVQEILGRYPECRKSFKEYNETQKRSGRPDLVLKISSDKGKDR